MADFDGRRIDGAKAILVQTAFEPGDEIGGRDVSSLPVKEPAKLTAGVVAAGKRTIAVSCLAANFPETPGNELGGLLGV